MDEEPSVGQRPPTRGELFLELRELCDWTQEDLARESGVTDRTIRNVENDQVVRKKSLDALLGKLEPRLKEKLKDRPLELQDSMRKWQMLRTMDVPDRQYTESDQEPTAQPPVLVPLNAKPSTTSPGVPTQRRRPALLASRAVAFVALLVTAVVGTAYLMLKPMGGFHCDPGMVDERVGRNTYKLTRTIGGDIGCLFKTDELDFFELGNRYNTVEIEPADHSSNTYLTATFRFRDGRDRELNTDEPSLFEDLDTPGTRIEQDVRSVAIKSGMPTATKFAVKIRVQSRNPPELVNPYYVLRIVLR